MLDRVKLNKILDARDALEGIIKVEVTVWTPRVSPRCTSPGIPL